jgi:drug/metabolite transporter, DME family
MGMVLYTLGSRVIPAAELTLLSLIEVLLAPIWVWLALGETASAATLSAAGSCWRRSCSTRVGRTRGHAGGLANRPDL